LSGSISDFAENGAWLRRFHRHTGLWLRLACEIFLRPSQIAARRGHSRHHAGPRHHCQHGHPLAAAAKRRMKPDRAVRTAFATRQFNLSCQGASEFAPSAHHVVTPAVRSKCSGATQCQSALWEICLCPPAAVVPFVREARGSDPIQPANRFCLSERCNHRQHRHRDKRSIVSCLIQRRSQDDPGQCRARSVAARHPAYPDPVVVLHNALWYKGLNRLLTKLA
jgi:hypothetical protein